MTMLEDVLQFTAAKLSGVRTEDSLQVDLGALFDAFSEGSPERAQLEAALGDATSLKLLEPQSMGSTIWTILEAGRTRLAGMGVATLPIGTRLGDWIIAGRLGAGGQADAYLVRQIGGGTTTVLRVAKVLKKWSQGARSPDARVHAARFVEEVGALEVLGREGCPNIVPVLDRNLDEQARELWYVMPFYALGSLRSDRGGEVHFAEAYKGNLDRVIELGELVASTLAFMHERGRVHRDVTSSNIFVDVAGGPCLLGDFGLSHERRDDPAPLTGGGEALGAWRCRPPELAAGSEHRFDPASDVYMLGCTMFELLTGGEITLDRYQLPNGTFVHEKAEVTIGRFSKDPRVARFNSLLRHLVAEDTRDRMSAARLAEQLKLLRTQLDAEGIVVLPIENRMATVARAAKDRSIEPPRLFRRLG